jgi:alkane 1-monooxygenase
MQIKAIGYLAAFAVPALMPLSAWLGQFYSAVNIAAILPIVVLYVVLPVLDYLIGRDAHNPDAASSALLERQSYYKALTLMCVPIYLATLFYSAHVFCTGGLSIWGQIAWTLSQGVVGGVLAINVAHELIHKSNKLEQTAGGVLLASVCYGGFKIEHVRGHHVHVSTPLDASSARLGQTVYGFVAQAVPRNMLAAIKLEANRLNKLGLSAWHYRNEFLQWMMVSILIASALTYLWGIAGLLFFIGQSIGAFVSLEVINYIEHYGLSREKLADGRFERTTHLHSWNSNYLLTNLILFQLQRHSDHHENPKRRYQSLVHYDESPQLPGGYASMFLLALVPPLWFSIIDPLVAQHQQKLQAKRRTDATTILRRA